MLLLELYEQAIARGEIEADDIQREVLEHFEALRAALLKHRPWWVLTRKTTISGIYLVGEVGVGKTFLMDLFYESLPFQMKQRLHFHHFMQQIDAQLRQRQGQKDPVKQIAKQIAATTRVLCFDEFFVHDVAHALMLTELLTTIIQQGVVLVMTSNLEPDKLYLNGVQRDRFLPTIALLKNHCCVLTLGSRRDYRLGRIKNLKSYFSPVDKETEGLFNQQFEALESDNITIQGELSVQKRPLPFIFCGTHAICFDFSVICQLPRSQLDYLEIAERFNTVFIKNVPKLNSASLTAVILLIHLVDVFYDQGIKLILLAEVPLDQLYTGGEMSFEFKRTFSRLKEMQSNDYLQRHPRRKRKELS